VYGVDGTLLAIPDEKEIVKEFGKLEMQIQLQEEEFQLFMTVLMKYPWKVILFRKVQVNGNWPNCI